MNIQLRIFTNLRYRWVLEDSNFNFYYDNNLIQNNQYCSKIYLSNINYFPKVIVLLLSSNVLYSKQTCPFIFKNTYLKTLAIKQLTESSIFTNMLSFRHLNQTELSGLNSTILIFKFISYITKLDTNLLNKQVFEYLIIFDFIGQFNSIQFDLFKSFSHLIVIRFQMQYISRLFHKNTTWLNYINLNYSNHLNKYVILSLYQTFPNLVFYKYPNEDICLFENFPHDRQIFPKLYPEVNLELTCTQLFLIQYAYKHTTFINKFTHNLKSTYFYFDTDIEYAYKPFSKLINSSIDDLILKCDFKSRFQKCHIDQAKETREEFFVYFYVFDLIFASKLIQFTFRMILLPILALSSILGCIIQFIHFKKEEKTLKDKQYEYLKYNLIFSLIYCVIAPFSIVNFCIDESKLFCSPIYKNLFAQYFYIVIIKLVGNSARTCSFWSNASYSMSRYIKISATKNSFLKKIDQISSKSYLLIILTFSLLINVSIVFEYSVHKYDLTNIIWWEGYILQEFYDYPLYSSVYYVSKDYRRNFFATNTSKLLVYFHLVRVVLSDVLYIIFTLVFDILLYFFIKKNEAKNLIKTHFNKNMRSKKNIKEFLKRRQRKRSLKKISSNIILNIINFFIFKLPLVVFGFLRYLLSFYLVNLIEIKSKHNI